MTLKIKNTPPNSIQSGHNNEFISRYKLLFIFCVLLLPMVNYAAIWPVGPNKTYKYCSQVASLVQQGDTITIDAALYVNDAQVQWTKNNLFIVGIGGRPRLQAGSVIAGVGERTREGNDLLREMIEANVIRYGEAFKHSMEAGGWDLSKVDKKELSKSQATLVFGQMNEPPGARARVALSGLTIAEYFRDGDLSDPTGGRDILFFIDNIFRFTQAGSELSALLGRMPSAVGYQPTLATEMGLMQERITSTKRGSITSVQAVYVPADDLTDPAPATTFAHLDATTVKVSLL